MFGPSFPFELKAAGLTRLPFSTDPDGNIFGRENLTPGEAAILDAVIAVHDPTIPWPPIEETPLTAEDVEKLFLSVGVTPGQIADTKRSRGNP
jgi:hypothetical protein